MSMSNTMLDSYAYCIYLENYDRKQKERANVMVGTWLLVKLKNLTKKKVCYM